MIMRQETDSHFTSMEVFHNGDYNYYMYMNSYCITNLTFGKLPELPELHGSRYTEHVARSNGLPRQSAKPYSSYIRQASHFLCLKYFDINIFEVITLFGRDYDTVSCFTNAKCILRKFIHYKYCKCTLYRQIIYVRKLIHVYFSSSW